MSVVLLLPLHSLNNWDDSFGLWVHTELASLSCLFVSWQPIMKFINDQYEAYLQEEINIDRKKRIPDSRVHCCLYFIPPTGHW